MKHTILLLIFCSFAQVLIAQNQPGLHVDPTHTVLFGLDTTSVGLKLMWQPSKGAIRAGKMSSGWGYGVLGNVSAAFGSNTQASGNFSFATGIGATANSFSEFSIGRYSLDGGHKTVWDSLDVIFEIGNGVSAGTKSNLLTVQKNGNVKIGDMTESTYSAITERLVVDGGIVVGDALDTTPSSGTIRWNAEEKDFEGWTGTEWVSFSKHPGGDDSPTIKINTSGKVTPSDADIADFFGNSVSISEDYAIVGAYKHDDDANGISSGSAYIFQRNGDSWIQQSKITASDGVAGDNFGSSVSISGDYAIIGAYKDDDNGSNSGSAYIFHRNGNSWDQQAKITPTDGQAEDGFGFSVSISGDYTIIGAYKADDNGSNSGSAYIFHRNVNSWNQQAKITPTDGQAEDGFGFSVSISEDYAIVGATLEIKNGSDSAYIFHRNGISWSQQSIISPSDGATQIFFGYAVAISGEYAIVGAPVDNENGYYSGSAYIFHRNGNNWSQQEKIFAADATPEDGFGISLSISVDYIIIGATGDDYNGNLSGSSYLFHRSGSSWSQQEKISASDGTPESAFGVSVSISGEHLIIGSSFDDVNGLNSGSAYFFKYN